MPFYILSDLTTELQHQSLDVREMMMETLIQQQLFMQISYNFFTSNKYLNGSQISEKTYHLFTLFNLKY